MDPDHNESDLEWERWIEGLRGGDDRAVADFCDGFGERLQAVASRHVVQGMRRRFGPETVVQSACCSFLRRAREGEYRLDDAESLWRLMCAITLRKVREKARFHLRHKRGVDRETSTPDGEGVNGAVDSRPAPDEAAAIAEEFERLLASLEEEDRRIVELKLEERTNGEIAEVLGCSERTVRRLLAQLREKLAKTFAA